MDFSWGRNGTDNFFSGEFVLFSREGKECVGKINNFNLDGQENSLHAEVSLCEKGYGGESPELFIDADQQFIIDLNDRVNVSLEICSPLPLSRESLQKIHLMKKMTDKDGRESIIMMNENEREHFYKRKTQTLPVVKVPLNLFIDDLSVTKSRRWSPIHGVQAQLSGLPLSEKTKGKNTHFLSASDTVTMMDLLQPICSNIQHCKENGIKCFDALMKEEVLVTSDISLIVSDYQMMSLACNHLGPSANKFCPNCYVDHSNPFCVAEMRTVEKTTKTLDLLKLRSNTTGRQQLERQSGVKLYDNCLWKHIDPHRDTPIGILHFLYLGLARHLVQLCVKNIPSNKVQTLETHLSSIDQSGFSYHINGNTFFKYLDSRQGKDFKHYLQIAPHNMAFVNVNKEYVTALEKLSLISKHIQQSKPDIEKEFIEYIEYVERNIPELGKKNKTHFCLHIGDDIHRHGSPLHYAEDQFEKNHGPIRNSFHHQNGHARSRDTVLQFTKCELTQHIVTGGYFMRDDEWQCAEKEVISYGRSKKILSYLGMMEEEEAEKGEVKNAMRSNNRKILNVANALDEVYLLRLSILANISQSKIKAIYSYTSLTAERGELINTGSFVLYYQDSKNHIGVLERIFDIATRDRQTISVAFLRKARSVPDCQDGHQRVEVTSDTDHIRTSDILHPVHTIHDCRRGNCRMVEKRRTKRMEQENTTTTEVYLEHNDQYKTYILNKFRLDSLPEKLCFC